MKKLMFILAVSLMLPLGLFAQVGLGGAAFFKSPVLLGQPVDVGKLNVNQFTFGGDARLKLGWFQVEGLMLYSTGEVSSLDIYLDAGVALDLALIRLSAGAGPNFVYNFDNEPATQAGLNAKVGAELKLGRVSFGLSYIMGLTLNSGIGVHSGTGLLGANATFWFE